MRKVKMPFKTVTLTYMPVFSAEAAQFSVLPPWI